MVLCLEKFAARDVQEAEETKTATAVWNIFGAPDEVAARAALIAALPAAYSFPSGVTGYLSNLQVKDIFESSDEKDLTHEATVTYSGREPRLIDAVEYEFDTTATESFTRSYALATTNVTAGGRAVPNFFGAINPASDGSIKGIEVEESVFSFSLVKQWDATLVTTAYQWQLGQMTKKINDAPFGPIPAKCCRFMGARGKINGSRWPIEYRFEVRAPETFTVRDMAITKAGYQHVSVYRAKFADATAKKVIEIPWACYVQDVIETADFGLLQVAY